MLNYSVDMCRSIHERLNSAGHHTNLLVVEQASNSLCDLGCDPMTMHFPTVVGHTDSTGFDDFNTLLSRDRALAVLEALTLGGVAADSLSAFGRGESKPRSSNRTADGRARNSRIEILLEPATA
jgi:hypothetical protein